MSRRVSTRLGWLSLCGCQHSGTRLSSFKRSQVSIWVSLCSISPFFFFKLVTNFMDQSYKMARFGFQTDHQLETSGSDVESLVGAWQERRKRFFSFPVSGALISPSVPRTMGVWCPECTHRCLVGQLRLKDSLADGIRRALGWCQTAQDELSRNNSMMCMNDSCGMMLNKH